VTASQLALFETATLVLDASFGRATRTELPGPADDPAWVEHVPGWLAGQQQLFEELERSVVWHQEDRVMYQQRVQVPRLYATLPEDRAVPSILRQAQALLQKRYGEDFARISLGYYRDGSDSVAWHGDYVAREMPRATVATLSLGAPRPFLLRPQGGGASRSWSLGWGDLFVMGGSCQRTWQHAIPKRKQAAARIAVMFRPIWPNAETACRLLLGVGTMANSNPIATDAPPAHVGAEYENPSTKPLRGPFGPTERDGVQRLVWSLLFGLVLAIVAVGVLLSIVRHTP
jgi:alkylated DNA repair dioxygenase AlkB